MLQKLQIFFEKAFRFRKEKLRLMISDTEVTLYKDGTELWRFRWDDVTRIVTYKRDLGIVDLICLDFSIARQNSTYPTHEEMQGFGDLREQMQHCFPTIGEHWWSEVALPAFAANEKILYDKPAA